MTPNHALHLTAAGRRSCNRRVLWPPSLSWVVGIESAIMSRKLKSTAKFAVVMFAMTIACTIVWQMLMPGWLYDCSDDNMAGFLRPGDWVHHPVSVPHVVLSRTMSEPDTIKAGWIVTDLWLLWFSFLGISVVVSFFVARRRWLPRKNTMPNKSMQATAAAPSALTEI